MITKYLDTAVKDIDKKGRITVSANYIGNIDVQQDKSMDGSFDKTFKEHFTRTRWFLNHDTRILLGVPLEGKQVGQEVHMVGQLNMAKEISRDTYEDYKLYAEHGRSLEHSIGVDAIKYKMNGNVREVSEWKLWEYSTLTSWGANDKTRLVDMKSADEISEAINWLEVKMRKGNYTDEAFINIQNQLKNLRALALNKPDDSTNLIIEPSMDDIRKAFSNFTNQLK